MQIINAVIIKDVDDLVEKIQLRDIKVQTTQRELVALWISQGIDMLKLHKDFNYTQENISELAGVSIGSVNMYISFANDKRLVSLIFSDECEKQDNKKIERFNQKELKKLTTLNDVEFNQTIESGKFPKNIKEDKSIELTVDEQILNRQEHIQQLKDEIKTLQIQSGLDVDDIFEVAILKVKAKPQFELKPVNKIDLKSGNILESFKSLGDASNQTGYSQSSISKCCNNKQKQAHGFKWRYTDAIADT